METKDILNSSIYKNPTLIVMLILTIGLWVGGIIFIYPKIFEAFDARAQHDQLSDQLADTTKKVLMVSDYDKQMYEDRVEKVLVKAMPRTFDIPLVVGAAVAVLRDFDFEVTSAKSASGPVDSNAVAMGKVLVGFEGKKANLDGFLDKLTKVSPLMRGTDITYSLTSNDFEEEMVKIDLVFSTFAVADAPVDKSNNPDNLVIPNLLPEDQILFESVASLEQVTPVLDIQLLGDENWDPFQPVVK